MKAQPFTDMKQQLGGSFGIAIITTLMAKKRLFHRSNLVSNFEVNNPAVQNTVNGLTQSYIVKGFPSNISHGKALQTLDYMVTKQAMVLTYMDVFWFIGWMFFICVPFVLRVKERKEVTVGLGDELNVDLGFIGDILPSLDVEFVFSHP